MINTAPEHHSKLFRFKKSTILQLVAVSLAVIVFVPQFEEFTNSWAFIQGAQLNWLVLAGLCMASTVVFATLVYIALIPYSIPFRRTTIIQLATFFTNRLLPSGLGGIGFNALYLTKQAKLSRTESAVYATANNIIGFIAFFICVGIATLITESNIETNLPVKNIILALGAVLLIGAIISLTISRVQKKLIDFMGQLFGVILAIVRHPKRMILAILFSMGITAGFVAVLWATTKSVGVELSLLDLFIAFIAGNTALTVSPTPGGIGAVEAAITAVVISAGVDPSVALASVVLFRLVSYWLPIIPGYIAFRFAVKKSYV